MNRLHFHHILTLNNNFGIVSDSKYRVTLKVCEAVLEKGNATQSAFKHVCWHMHDKGSDSQTTVTFTLTNT